MIILTVFAFLAGIATIFAPCILPILPVVLSAGITGGRQRPIGIIVGLVASFTFFTLALSYLVATLGLSPDALRTAAIVILLAFGLALAIPRLYEKVELWLSAHIPQGNSTSTRTDFWGGVLIGASLGLVWTPCVGPIVASVITLAATSSVSFSSVLITAAYALGTGLPLLALMYGGKTVLKRVRSFAKYSGRIQQVFGVVMIATAVGMLLGLDRTLQTALLAKVPSDFSSGLTQQLERGSLVQDEIRKLKGKSQPSEKTPPPEKSGTSGLPVLGAAPELTGIETWLNSDPLTLASLKGKVVLVDFWTYSCINCVRTLPHVTGWYDTYKDQGFVVVGVHAPEFAFEKDTTNVRQAIAQYDIRYPVALDNTFATWSAYENQYWPTKYLIDAQGRVRTTHFGEGKYQETEANIRALLLERDQAAALPAAAPVLVDSVSSGIKSPETYFGTDRQTGLVERGPLSPNKWLLSGGWRAGREAIVSGEAGDSMTFRFTAKQVYAVITPPQEDGATATIYLDGQPIGALGGADAVNGSVSLTASKLYHLVSLLELETHEVTIIFDRPGTQLFTLTFG